MAILSTPLQFVLATPPVTRAFTAATFVVSFVYFVWSWNQYAPPWIALMPGSSIFYPWTFVTSGLVEMSIPDFIFTMMVVPPSLRYLERLWGSIEMAKFIVVCLAFPNIIAGAFNWLEFVVTQNASLYLYGMQYHGQTALIASILVAFTQLIPEHQVQVLGVIKARVKVLPMAYLTFSTLIVILGYQSPYILIQFGWFVSWIYLRFYKKNTSDMVGGDTYGDRSETFSLISWFPPFVHTPLGFLANTTHRLATRFHLIPAADPDLGSANYSQLPGGARAEAERRRAMALKALDQRFANNAPAPQNGGPSQASRPPPSPSVAQAENSVPSASPARPLERQKSEDLGDIGRPENS